jgi:hypothetical protein
MKADCPRLFEVEALRDGRLAGRERRDFERHLTSCRDCSRERRALEELGEALRSSSPAVDELHVRRERTRLVAAFDRSLVEPEARGWPWQRLLVLTAAATLLAGALLLWRTERAEPVAAPHAVVDATAGARWSQRSEADRQLVFLEQGALRIRVAPESHASALLVVLPGLAPVATRIASSCRRLSTRASVRLATLAQTIKRTKPIAAKSPSKVWCTCSQLPPSCSIELNGRSVILRPPSGSRHQPP